jgi:hypothetical protein
VQEIVIDDIIGVINATGFRAGVPWLPNDVSAALGGLPKNEIGTDFGHNRIPYLLREFSTYNDSVPDLAFVGYYEGPYWGVAELQARLVARRWAGQAGFVDGQGAAELVDLVELRSLIRQRDPRIPPFWMGDYVGVMEAAARELGLARDSALEPPNLLGETGPVLPARYVAPDGDKREARKTLGELSSLSLPLRFLPAAVFRNLQGPWFVQTPNLEPGRLDLNIGVANWYPRHPTHPLYAAEYLCRHEVEMKSSEENPDLAVDRWDVWRYNEAKDEISVWSIEHDKKVDELLFKLRFDGSSVEVDSFWKREEAGWLASLPDLYRVNCDITLTGFLFPFTGAFFRIFEASAVVRDDGGPPVEKTLIYRRMHQPPSG